MSKALRVLENITTATALIHTGGRLKINNDADHDRAGHEATVTGHDGFTDMHGRKHHVYLVKFDDGHKSDIDHNDVEKVG